MNTLDDEYSSCMERVLGGCFAPCLVSNKGRVSVLIGWTLAGVAASIGIKLLESNFSVEFFVPKGSVS